MRIQILFFLALSLFIYVQAASLPTAYFYLLDSSKSKTNSLDGESQFFDYPTGMNIEIPLNLSTKPKLFNILKEFLVKNFSIPENSLDHIKLVNIKSYWRSAGYLPMGLVESEMKLSNADKMHIAGPNETMLSVQYLFYKMPIPAALNPYHIKHQVMEVCVNLLGHDNRHFIVDRAYRGVAPDIWNSRIRLIYTGKSDNCDFHDGAWADKRSGVWNDSGNITAQLHVVDQAVVQKIYSFTDLITGLENYFLNFPVYNVMYNCQHFGTNLFNHLTGKNDNFISAEVMIIKDIKVGVTNAIKLIFDFFYNLSKKNK